MRTSCLHCDPDRPPFLTSQSQVSRPLPRSAPAFPELTRPPSPLAESTRGKPGLHAPSLIGYPKPPCLSDGSCELRVQHYRPLGGGGARFCGNPGSPRWSRCEASKFTSLQLLQVLTVCKGSGWVGWLVWFGLFFFLLCFCTKESNIFLPNRYIFNEKKRYINVCTFQVF